MAQIALTGSFPQRIRPFNPLSDLTDIADLMNMAFASHLDESGRHSIEEMRRLGQENWLWRLFWRSVQGKEWGLTGFVWVEEGHIIGNVTLQVVKGQNRRWQIANVAVHPDYQGQGIGRALMLASLTEIRKRHGEWAVLEVRADNEVAIHLYEALGFSACGGKMHWKLSPERLAAVGPSWWPALRRLPLGKWHSLWELAHNALSTQQLWWRPFTVATAQMLLEEDILEGVRRLFNREHLCNLALWLNREQLAAFLRLESWPKRPLHELIILFRPGQREEWYHRLLLAGVTLAKQRFLAPVMLTTPREGQSFFPFLEEVGFRSSRDSLYMRLRVEE